MNKEGLEKISYGIYIINTQNSGCIVNTLTRVTNDKIIATAIFFSFNILLLLNIIISFFLIVENNFTYIY